jgi:hypothetical protein
MIRHPDNIDNEQLSGEINKRLTLNWLIQGASQHAGLTLHHLVRDELNAIDPALIALYDQQALIHLLQYWHVEAFLIMGSPNRFWRRAATKPRHPFFRHPLLSRHGGALATAAKERALQRCKEKGVTRTPVLFTMQATLLISRLQSKESPYRPALVALAKEAASRVWGMPVERMDADLAGSLAFTSVCKARSLRDAILHAAIAGYGGVMRRHDRLTVVARAVNFSLLAKELVKGTAELICLHGLNRLDDETYARVVHATDRLEYEPWMLQSGGELWRRLLAVMPEDRAPAEMLMHLAHLPAHSLESLMLAVIEQPDWARELLASLGTGAYEQE